MLPSFVIVGAMRGGTSALTRAISQHPDVFIAPGKEMHFFNRNFERGLDWYEGRFAGSDAAAARGEATPLYMYDPQALRRMVETLPSARFIAIIRHPVDRSYSHYWHNRRRDRERQSFEEAIRLPPKELIFEYLQMSRYTENLRELESLAPGRLLVLINEDLRNRRAETLDRVWRFIGVDPARGTVEPRSPRRSLMASLRRRRRVPRDYPPMDPATRAGLLEEFKGEVAALEEWLGRDLTAWRS